MSVFSDVLGEEDTRGDLPDIADRGDPESDEAAEFPEGLMRVRLGLDGDVGELRALTSLQSMSAAFQW